MIKYFQFKTRLYSAKNNLKLTLSVSEARYRVKNKHGDNKVVIEQYVRKTASILIIGKINTGKSYFLNKFYSYRAGLWAKKPVVKLNSFDPISQWLDFEGLRIFIKNKKLNSSRQFHNIQALELYCRICRPVVFIDDLQVLSGRKAQIIKACIKGNLFVATVSDSKSLPPFLKKIVLGSRVQKFKLGGNSPFSFFPRFLKLFVDHSMFFFVTGLLSLLSLLIFLVTTVGVYELLADRLFALALSFF